MILYILELIMYKYILLLLRTYHLSSFNASLCSLQSQSFWQLGPPRYLMVLAPSRKPPELTRVPSGASPPHEHHGSTVTCRKG